MILNLALLLVVYWSFIGRFQSDCAASVVVTALIKWVARPSLHYRHPVFVRTVAQAVEQLELTPE